VTLATQNEVQRFKPDFIILSFWQFCPFRQFFRVLQQTIGPEPHRNGHFHHRQKAVAKRIAGMGIQAYAKGIILQAFLGSPYSFKISSNSHRV
jgi:hypothetical protein